MGCTVSTALAVREESLEELAPAWEQLLDRAGIRWPFLRPSWLRTWLATQAPAGDLLLLSVCDGRELVGVAPLLRRGTELSFAGDSEICDYMDLIAPAGLHETVLDAVLAYLRDYNWTRLMLWGLRADSPTLAALAAAANQHGLWRQVDQEAVCPRVELPATWDQYLLTLSKKDRHELRRKIRRMAEAGDSFHEYGLSGPDEIAAAMPDFLLLHRESRQDKADFMTPAMERFFTEMTVALAPEDLIRLYFLEIDARRVAAVLAFNCGDELWLYNSGFDPAFASASVGLVSKALVLRQAIKEGKDRYDFLRGAEAYKYDLGGRDLCVFRATLMRPDTGASPSEPGDAC